MTAWLYWSVAIPTGLLIGWWMRWVIQEVAQEDSRPLTLLYCDHCAAQCFEIDMFHYGAIPWDVDSALAGESASLCRYCNNAFHRRHRVDRERQRRGCDRRR